MKKTQNRPSIRSIRITIDIPSNVYFDLKRKTPVPIIGYTKSELSRDQDLKDYINSILEKVAQ